MTGHDALYQVAASIRGAVTEIETTIADLAIAVTNSRVLPRDEIAAALGDVKRELRHIETNAVSVQDLARSMGTGATLPERRAFLLALFAHRGNDPIACTYVEEKVDFALAPPTSALALRSALDRGNLRRYEQMLKGGAV